MPHVLIVDDEASTRAAIAELVGMQGFTTALAGDLREARIQIVRQYPDVVLTDLRLPDGSGMDLFADLGQPSGVEVVVMTGHASVESAVDALRLGASDYLVKPINIGRLNAVLSRIPRSSDLKAEIGSLRGELRRFGRFGLMLGNSPVMQSLYDQVTRVAPTEATVFLIGESGTGKEVAAQTIHELSLRRKQPFLAVNCGAISPNLIESEMFGHEKGSFTGADRQHKGYFERANGGTLFLDELTEMPIDLQVKLLRVLETGLFMRVGTNKEIATDIRVIAATNRDPLQAVEEGKLRGDLYHRLNVFPLVLPPLRERGKDIELLAENFLEYLNKDGQTEKNFSKAFLGSLHEHCWPGNVRELKNYVQRAYIMADGTEINHEMAPLQVALARTDSSPIVSIPVGTSLADVNRILIMATLDAIRIKKTAAKVLGISLKTLYNRLEEYGLVAQYAGDVKTEVFADV
ncbi:MAG: sigma-54-dependent transcriptional regulator [Burkholderiaceae bacterium]|jgi:two-component system response regulator AtoC